MANNVVLVTGAAGFLASLVRPIYQSGSGRFPIPAQVAKALLKDPQTPNIRLILADISEPKNPDSNAAHIETIKADLTKAEEVDALFNTPFGVPDTIYCMHGIMSRGSEDHFDFALKACT